MTDRCADLDEFFDGELAADQADAFRDHLATCERCERVLEGRMQESIAVRMPAARLEQPAVAPAPAARTMAREVVPPAPAVPPAAAAVPIDPRRARGCGRYFIYAAPILAAAAAVPLWLGRPDDVQPLTSSLDFERGPVARGKTAHVGDVLHFKVHGERHRAIWVYLDGRDLVAACPDDERCTEAAGELEIQVQLRVRGRYAAVALGSADAIPPPATGKTLDELLATQRAAVHTKVDRFDVD